MRTLNHITVALSGINLIEASAGTGKTYAIALLYLRLLVEQELLPEQSRLAPIFLDCQFLTRLINRGT